MRLMHLTLVTKRRRRMIAARQYGDAAKMPRSAMGQGRLWPAGRWHSRSTPSSGIPGAARRLRFVPNSEVATTRLSISNWSSGRSYLCNGDAGDREQPTDNQLWGHTVAKEQHARNQGEHRKQQAEWCDAAH
jgi:hypothetical protein